MTIVCQWPEGQQQFISGLFKVCSKYLAFDQLSSWHYCIKGKRCICLLLLVLVYHHRGPLMGSRLPNIGSHITSTVLPCCRGDRLDCLVVKASTSRAKDLGFESCLRRDFSGSSHTSDTKIGTPETTLPGSWRYRVSTGTGRHGVSIL